ncbi:hypothetical protein VTL71DRAFT_8826 [Oculimacula yallundae]|uniref:Rhodopsin domain-containing protein n=1 Tax=Oculimacula yallundae TaxID=86028 RepID=A0ABR4D0Z0_9HELO
MESDISPGPDTNLASIYLLLCGPLAGLALIFCTTRIYTRSRPVCRLVLDDYLIIAAELLSLAGYFFGYIAASHGWGHVSFYISPADQKFAFNYVFGILVISLLTVPLVRISVACSLMRFGNSRLWRWTLYTLINVQILLSTVWLVIPFFNCTPLRLISEPVLVAKCWPHEVTDVFAWFSTCTVIVMDVTLATMPLNLIRLLNRPVAEKLLIACLMAMGLVATGLVAANTVILKNMYQGDPLSSTVGCTTLAKLEELVGIIAACLPCLKAPAEKFLRRIGVLPDQRTSMWMPSFVDPKPFSNSANPGNRTYVDISGWMPTNGRGRQPSIECKPEKTYEKEADMADVCR